MRRFGIRIQRGAHRPQVEATGSASEKTKEPRLDSTWSIEHWRGFLSASSGESGCRGGSGPPWAADHAVHGPEPLRGRCAVARNLPRSPPSYGDKWRRNDPVKRSDRGGRPCPKHAPTGLGEGART